ncbi:biotin--[acetyl-CoA-carboxylase] ligase [Adlercreutzia sp. R25]|uniref:biotin--[biotin carboxyl-carrier protein] ligase n=1 Tax=Adlercreutzia shanghongiae TaxID=3111773 RepID=A0ABU6IY48_9ACTN|nr:MULTISPECIES: biotin--[acetyl-CoA-carboxylase] ligase [unclassified Adlercreutzia]MEC4271775.1 biotin--[acetyl-CoA-carboxylase] ligase [Adlercreutzia sp. R25]MEC4294782.1 biotin--[acetyl-CoA-carboxylase] ligase [Adlercreutzia sp. R22]
MKLTVLDEVASTNEVVKNALREGKAEGLIVRARRQNSGYGRQGREWDSPAGGLYMSVLLRPDVAGSGLATLSLVVGLSVQRALAALAAPPFEDGIQVKWPNDVVYLPADCERADEYRKLCGISLEACGGGVCVGIGINVFRPDVDVPVQGRNVPAYMAELMLAPESQPGTPMTVAEAAAALPEREQAARREGVITDIQREVIARMLVSYGRWRELGFTPSLGSFEAASFLPGRLVRVEDAVGATTVEGTVTGVDERGRLLVRTADGTVPVASGEAHVMVMP